MSGGTDLSAGLQALLNDLSPLAGEADGIIFDQAEFQKFVHILRLMHAMAINLEIEVRCLRDMEASAAAHEVMEGEATDQLSDLPGELESKVLRPNFGRRP